MRRIIIVPVLLLISACAATPVQSKADIPPCPDIFQDYQMGPKGCMLHGEAGAAPVSVQP
jgi:hypothetical protein